MNRSVFIIDNEDAFSHFLDTGNLGDRVVYHIGNYENGFLMKTIARREANAGRLFLFQQRAPDGVKWCYCAQLISAEAGKVLKPKENM